MVNLDPKFYNDLNLIHENNHNGKLFFLLLESILRILFHYNLVMNGNMLTKKLDYLYINYYMILYNNVD